MMSKTSRPKLLSAGQRAIISLAIGVIVGSTVGWIVDWQFGPVVGWDVAALVYAAWTWRAIGYLTPQQTANLALREDPGRAATDGLLVAASVASLVGIGLLLFEASSRVGLDRLILISLSSASVLASWVLVHTIFTLRYARLYYSHPAGGIDFNQLEPPNYVDFAYMAFTIGMTFQVSDTTISARPIRSTLLRHAILSYLFGTVIVATVINLIVGLSK
jgi:uncharacterized membrane protein